MPLVPPRPLRPRKTTIHRPWVKVSQQVGSALCRSVVPLQCLLLLNVPSKLTRSIAGEGAGAAGRGYAAGSSTVASLLPLPPRLLFARCFIFKAAWRVRSPAKMLWWRPARPPPRAVEAHAARPRSGESARSRRSQEKLHGSTRSEQLFSSLPRSLFLNNISLVGGLGFIIIIVIILNVIFVVVAPAAAPVNLSHSLSASF